MLAVWTFIKGAFSFIVKNWGWIASVLMLLFIFLFFNQCGATRKAKAETEEAKLIADNNLKAMKDSTIVLKVTREQLALIDNNLSKVVRELDSLKKHPKTVIIIRPEYIPKDVITPNELVRDSVDITRYGLKFASFDSVRTIKGTSWFNVLDGPTSLEVKPNSTIINDFALNFGLVVAKYDDKENKMTRLSVQPYYVDNAGNYTKPISENMLKMHIRGADLLEVPYVDDTKPCPPPKHKYSIRSGFSVSVNLVGVGYTPFTTPTAMNWVMPSLGIGYSFVLIKNK
jgi:hypothetical protein